MKALSRGEISCLSIRQEIIGHKGWDSPQQFFNILEFFADYVVVNHPSKIKQTSIAQLENINLIVRSSDDWCRLGALISLDFEYNKVRVLLGDEQCILDVRTSDSLYIDPNWANSILDSKVKCGYAFQPESMQNFYLFLYHVYLQKPKTPDGSIDLLIDMAAEANLEWVTEDTLDNTELSLTLIANYLKANDYQITRQPGRYLNDKAIKAFEGFEYPRSIPRSRNSLLLARSEAAQLHLTKSLRLQFASYLRDKAHAAEEQGWLEHALALSLQGLEYHNDFDSLRNDAVRIVQILEESENLSIDRMAGIGLEERVYRLYQHIHANAQKLVQAGENAAGIRELLRALELVPQSDEIRKALERVTSTPAPKFLFMSVEKRPIMRIGRFINSLLPKKCAQAIWEIRKKLSK